MTPPEPQTVDTYTHGHQDAVLRSHRWRTVANSAAYLLPHLESGVELLDVGCGPGSLTIDLARRVAPGQVVAVDLSAEVIAEATAAASEAGVDNVSFLTRDFRQLVGTNEDRFDIVHAHQVLQHLSDPVGALRTFRRLARPGGIVAARDGDYAAMTWFPQSEHLDRWRAIYLAVTKHNRAEANAGRRLLAWAHQAGFSEVTYTASTWTFADDATRRWWADLWAERTTSSSLAAQAVEYGIATPGELATVAAGWRDWSAQTDAIFLAPNGEILARA